MQGLDRFGRFVNRRELSALAGQLGDGERVLAAVEATHAGLGKRGVLAATDRRLLFVRARLLGAQAFGWPYRQVRGVQRTAGVDDATLRVRAGGATMDFTGVVKAEALQFEEALAKRPRGPDELLDFEPTAAEADRRRRLERLDRMLERGSITRSEYERSKRSVAAEADSPDGGP